MDVKSTAIGVIIGIVLIIIIYHVATTHFGLWSDETVVIIPRCVPGQLGLKPSATSTGYRSINHNPLTTGIGVGNAIEGYMGYPGAHFTPHPITWSIPTNGIDGSKAGGGYRGPEMYEGPGAAMSEALSRRDTSSQDGSHSSASGDSIKMKLLPQSMSSHLGIGYQSENYVPPVFIAPMYAKDVVRGMVNAEGSVERREGIMERILVPTGGSRILGSTTLFDVRDLPRKDKPYVSETAAI